MAPFFLFLLLILYIDPKTERFNPTTKIAIPVGRISSTIITSPVAISAIVKKRKIVAILFLAGIFPVLALGELMLLNNNTMLPANKKMAMIYEMQVAWLKNI